MTKKRIGNSYLAMLVAFWLASSLGLFLLACGSATATPTAEPESEQKSEVSEVPSDETNSMDLPDSFESETFDGLGDATGFAGNTFAHGTFDTRDYVGKPMVINFWFPSCPPCRAELGEFENVYQKYGPPAGGEVQFVGVQQLGLDSIEDGAKLFDELGVTFPGLPDNNSAIQFAYNIFSYPSTIFLDKNHNSYRVWQGAIDEEQLTEIVEEIAGGAAVEIEGESSETDVVAGEIVAESVDGARSDASEPEILYAATEVFGGLGDAPGFKGDTFHHGDFDLSRFEGKPVVINFWYPSCPPCRAELPNFEHAYQNWGSPGNDQIVFVGVQAVSFDTAAEGEEFLGKMGVTYPAVPDVGSAIHLAYQIIAAPTTFFLDRDHNVLSVHQGYLKHNQLQDMLVQLVEE